MDEFRAAMRGQHAVILGGVKKFTRFDNPFGTRALRSFRGRRSVF